MSLTKTERTLIVSMWAKISTQADTIGTETLERLFLSYPHKAYSAVRLAPGSRSCTRTASKVVAAVARRSERKHPTTSGARLSKLKRAHAYVLRAGTRQLQDVSWVPGEGRRARGGRGRRPRPQLLSHCLLVTLAARFPADFTAEAHAAWDKFLAVVSSVLTEKYR
ncbi:PREDICTED: hemoglobin subunit zeta-like [Cercocebus atys]|uniref:hemoglobin subunit zeta-like n=1 Tax=Cercocebus atys TaxID=9531 RepID=UPI0005F4D960|nr:PREDICTED: hemoglobin subunit zeta-like [Cercocebus atys]